MQRRSVDFPAPLGPMTAMNSAKDYKAGGLWNL